MKKNVNSYLTILFISCYFFGTWSDTPNFSPIYHIPTIPIQHHWTSIIKHSMVFCLQLNAPLCTEDCFVNIRNLSLIACKTSTIGIQKPFVLYNLEGLLPQAYTLNLEATTFTPQDWV
jgi:hypothetical protein